MNLISSIKNYHSKNKNIRNWKNNLAKLLLSNKEYIEIKKSFDFLHNPTPIQIIWHVLNNDNQTHTCLNCGSPTKFNRQFFYHRLCSKKCTAIYSAKNMSAEERGKIVEKTKQTNIKKYGVSSAMKLDKYKNKKDITCLKKYG